MSDIFRKGSAMPASMKKKVSMSARPSGPSLMRIPSRWVSRERISQAPAIIASETVVMPRASVRGWVSES